MARQEIAKVDLLCSEHDVALTSPRGRVTILVPDDQYAPTLEQTDYGLGWHFDLDNLECPKDPDGDCVDSWGAFVVET